MSESTSQRRVEVTVTLRLWVADADRTRAAHIAEKRVWEAVYPVAKALDAALALESVNVLLGPEEVGNLAEVDRLRGLLRQVEWQWGEGVEGRCWFCDGTRTTGHAPDCELAATLGAT